MADPKIIRILLIEDDLDDQLLMQSYLLREGGGGGLTFRLRYARFLEEAIKLLTREVFDLVLLDLSLPDSRGLETLTRVRSEVGDLPVVVLTGWDDERVAVEAVAKGAQDYLVKGAIDGRLLIRAIAHAIERSRLLVSLRHSHEESFRAEIVERKRLDALKDEFISTVSHEIRTPLAIVKGAISNLKDGVLGPIPEKQLRVIDIANRNIDRLERIIRDLLDLSRLESGKARINRHWFNLSPMIAEMVQNFQMQAKEKQVSLHVELPSVIPDLYLDGDMVAQVLTNLLSNAIRLAKSTVTVRAEILSEEALAALGVVDETPSGVEKKGEAVQVSVIDDGVGIRPEEMGKLFSKFEQLHRPTGGAGYKGTGLGLAICHEIIHLHHGKIWAESTCGQGAVFHFVLPPWGEDADFWAALKKAFVSAAEKKRSVALLVVTSKNGVLDHATEEMLRHKVLRRVDGLYHYPSYGISLVLAETDSSGVESMVSRIREVMKDQEFRIGAAVYPDDAIDPKNLLNLAVQKAKAM